MAVDRSPSIADALLARLAGTPDAYPQKIDLVGRTVLLVEFDAGQYRAASFLDDRVLKPETRGAWLPVGPIIEASRRVTGARPLHFIFHTGHVGSTLLSRLLDETGAVLSLREPLPLRTLAEAFDALGRPDSLLSDQEFEEALAMFVRLWRRGYDGTHSVVVKATSSAGRLAAPILAASDASRAVYLNLAAEPYLATLLAGQNSPIDLRGHGAERFRRLQARFAATLAPLHGLSIGELAAMSWLAESLTQRSAIREFAGRVIPLDFDAFLADVAGGMRRVVAHFGLPANERFLSDVGRNPALALYSKAPEFTYTPAVRAEVLADSRRNNREEIRKGLQWLERQARLDETVAEVVNGADG
ncbi:MAG: hypothetical protein ABI724_09035 [Betaproteobacteria bacterium]